MLLDGEKRSAADRSFSAEGAAFMGLPVMRYESSIAAAIDEVMPHLLKPVATNIFGVFAEYLPIYGMPSSDIQSCVAQRYRSEACG